MEKIWPNDKKWLMDVTIGELRRICSAQKDCSSCPVFPHCRNPRQWADVDTAEMVEIPREYESFYCVEQRSTAGSFRHDTKFKSYDRALEFAVKKIREAVGLVYGTNSLIKSEMLTDYFVCKVEGGSAIDVANVQLNFKLINKRYK